MTAPLPPADLAGREPDLVAVDVGRITHRFYAAKKDPIFFDTSCAGRLNAPDGSYGVLYVAEETKGAFAETFLRQPGRTLIDEDLVQRKAYVCLKVTSELSLIKLAGPGLAKLGATAEVVHGGLPYDVPQAWSAALRAHPTNPHGIAYYARHDDEQLCYALFDHVRPALSETERREDLDQDWFWLLALEYRIGKSPSPPYRAQTDRPAFPCPQLPRRNSNASSQRGDALRQGFFAPS